MVVTLFPIFVIIYLSQDIFNCVFFIHPLCYNILLYPFHSFFIDKYDTEACHIRSNVLFHFIKKTQGDVTNIGFYYCDETLLIISGTVEVNAGPAAKKTNLQSIPARGHARIPLILSLQATCKFDIFGVGGGGGDSLSNKYITNDDILIAGLSSEPFPSDKSENMRNGGVCLYFKENLPVTERGDLETLPE